MSPFKEVFLIRGGGGVFIHTSILGQKEVYFTPQFLLSNHGDKNQNFLIPQGKHSRHACVIVGGCSYKIFGR